MKNYDVVYKIRITTARRSYDRTFSYQVKALCKLHALLKFKKRVKHVKHYQRKIINIKRSK